MTEIRKATTDDIDTIQAIAKVVWWPTYTPILTAEQIQYMLDTMYSAPVMQRQIETGEQTYLLLLADGEAVGFASYGPRTENTDVYKLQKLYCLVSTKGKGYGKLLLHAVAQNVLQAGKHVLELNVNRNNPALAFYEKQGFTIAYEEDIPIGNGYFMNDFVMRKDLRP